MAQQFVVQSMSIIPDFGRKPGANTLLYWSFNNQNLNDDSGNGRNGSRESGTGTYTQGIKGYGVNMLQSRAILLPMSCPTGNFTYSICINLSGYKDFQSLLGVSPWQAGCVHYHVSNSSAGNFVARAFGGGSNPDMRWNGTLQLNTRYNFIITRNGNVWSMYMNGTQAATTTYNFTPSSSFQWYVGKEYTDNRYINGIIDEVIFENRAWTDVEILKYVQKLGLA